MPPKNAEKLAEALISLINDRPLREQMGARGRLKALEYDWEQIAKRIADYYLKVINETPGRTAETETTASFASKFEEQPSGSASGKH